jgi:hydroxymethylglutaryl-CoA lyase
MKRVAGLSYRSIQTATRTSAFVSSTLPATARIVEVGLRDGLQNEKKLVTLQNKIKLLHILERSGHNTIELGSFVSPKWVPQMADSEALFQHLIERKKYFADLNSQTDNKGNNEVVDSNYKKSWSSLPIGGGGGEGLYIPSHSISYSALTPNMKGLESAIKTNCKEIAVFGAASEAFSMKNINCSIDESIDRFTSICETARKLPDMKIRGYVSCVLGCPYEGLNVDPYKVLHVAKKLLALGCYEVSLGDTIGIGNPGTTARLLEIILKEIPADKIAVHFHDTYGQSLANILVALQFGINVIDSSISGLGGCPYADGASGNVATEDVVYMLHGLNIQTGLDMETLFEAAGYIDGVLERKSGSKVTQAHVAKLKKKQARAAIQEAACPPTSKPNT